MNRKVLFAVLVTIMVTAGTLAAVYATGYLMTSNHEPFTGTSQAQIALSENASTGVAGIDTVQLTATQAGLTGTVTLKECTLKL